MIRDEIDLVAARDRLGGASLTGVLASDIRVVTLDFCGDGSPAVHMVLADELDTFIVACRRLHHTPGINPHSKTPTSRIWRIRVADLVASGPYWWGKPCLGETENGYGALLVDEGIFRTAWIDENHEVAA